MVCLVVGSRAIECSPFYILYMGIDIQDIPVIAAAIGHVAAHLFGQQNSKTAHRPVGYIQGDVRVGIPQGVKGLSRVGTTPWR